jgi:hypothetical protein
MGFARPTVGSLYQDIPGSGDFLTGRSKKRGFGPLVQVLPFSINHFNDNHWKKSGDSFVFCLTQSRKAAKSQRACWLRDSYLILSNLTLLE